MLSNADKFYKDRIHDYKCCFEMNLDEVYDEWGGKFDDCQKRWTL